MSVRTAAWSKLPSFDSLQAVRWRDVLTILVVPGVLVGAFTLPVETRTALAFEYTDPTLLTAFTSAYVHLTVDHLLVNVVGYLLVVPVAYLLSVRVGRRDRFFAALFTFVLAFPVVLSYLNLAVLRPAVGLGFSGVVMAFVGYLPLAIASYLDEFDVAPTDSTGPILFFVGLALIAVLSVRSVEHDEATVYLGTAGLVVAIGLSALLYALSIVERDGETLADARAGATAPGNAELLALGLLVLVAFPFVAFPANPTGGGNVLNFYVHLLGYALGFLVTFVTAEVGGRVGLDAA